MLSPLERLYDEHADALFAFVLNLTRNEADTRDVLQEVFLRLARRPHLLQGVRNERSFLLTMAHRMVIDGFRRHTAREKNHQAFASETVILFEPAADSASNDQAFRDAVAGALGLLPAEQRAVVHLKLWENLTFDAIANVLQIPLHTAASRYRYALDKLRAHLRPIHENRL